MPIICEPDESTARLRKFYADYSADGRLPLQPYVAATVRHREALISGKETLEAVAAKEKLNAKYLGVLWQTLTDKVQSQPLDSIRARWKPISRARNISTRAAASSTSPAPPATCRARASASAPRCWRPDSAF